MFKVGDRVGIKSNLAEIIEQKRRNREWYAETRTMIEQYAGEQGVITKIGDSACEIYPGGYVWGFYAIEPVDMNAIKYPVIL